MRLLAGLGVLIILFAVLVRSLPPAWAIPLYFTFVLLTIAFTGWERRRISERRRRLERELQKERMDASRRPKERSGDSQSRQ